MRVQDARQYYDTIRVTDRYGSDWQLIMASTLLALLAIFAIIFSLIIMAIFFIVLESMAFEPNDDTSIKLRRVDVKQVQE